MSQNVSKIGELLIQRGKLSQHQLNAALRNQGFFREHLGTTLFKMGFIDEDTLGEALSEISGVPYASPRMFEDLPPTLVSLLPTKLAEKHDIVPLKLEGRKMHVAMLDPRDLLVLDEIAFITGYSIQPWIAPEFRLYDALEHYYKLVSKRRRTIVLSDGLVSSAKRREAHTSRQHSSTAPLPRAVAVKPPPAASTAPHPPLPTSPAAPGSRPVPERGLDGLPLDAPPDISQPVPMIEEPGTTATDTPEGAPIESLEDAGRALQKAETREDVAEAILGYAGKRVKRAALFILQKESVIGWGGRGTGVELGLLKQLQIPRNAPSIFSTLHNDPSHYLGGVPDTPSNREIYRALGGTPPTFILLTPITIKGRPVAALYADDAGEPLNTQMDEILKLGRMAALALEILILRTKIMMA
jgi:hypothetical protein